jgi:hypothetical protein
MYVSKYVCMYVCVRIYIDIYIYILVLACSSLGSDCLATGLCAMSLHLLIRVRRHPQQFQDLIERFPEAQRKMVKCAASQSGRPHDLPALSTIPVVFLQNATFRTLGCNTPLKPAELRFFYVIVEAATLLDRFCDELALAYACSPKLNKQGGIRLLVCGSAVVDVSHVYAQLGQIGCSGS